MFQAIAPNAFFVFAGTFPTNNAIANLLLASPVTFYQGLGDFNRGVRLWNVGSLRAGRVAAGPSADGELRRALRADQPVHRDRGSAQQVRSRRAVEVRPDAPKGLVFPGDPGVAKGIAREREHVHAAGRRRLGSDRRRTMVGSFELRPLLRAVPERRRHDLAGGDQRHSGGAVQPVQRRRAQLRQPVSGPRVSGPEYLRASVDGVRDGRRREAALHAELER